MSVHDSSWRELTSFRELFFIQSSHTQPFINLSSALLGNISCRNPDGTFQFFNPETQFVSYCLSLLTGMLATIALMPPMLYRFYDLSRHGYGRRTVNGQISLILSGMIPLFFICWLFKHSVTPTFAEYVLTAGGIFAFLLHFAQDGKVSVCCPELLLYWSGMIAVYCSIAIDEYIQCGVGAWPLIVAGVSSILILTLELNNSSRRSSQERIAFDDASIFSKISISYANELLGKGAKDKITREDLPRHPAGLDTLNCTNQLENKLDLISSTSNYRLIVALLWALWPKILLLILLDVASDVVSYIQPSILGIFLGSLQNFVSGKSPLFYSFYYAVLLGVVPLITTGLTNLVSLMSSYTYVISRTAIVSIIYRKSLKIGPGARERYDSAKIMNLINVDSEQIDGVAQVLPNLVSAPISVVISTWQLWRFLGPSMFAAIALYVIVIPLTGFLSTHVGKLFPEQMAVKDQRNKLTSNAFRNIKSLKLYAWEKPFYDRISEVRSDKELKIQRKVSIYYTFIGLIWNIVGDMIGAAVFVMFLYLKQGALTPEIIFPSLMLLQYATSPFMALPMTLNALYRAFTSQKRLNEFLVEEDQDYKNYWRRYEPVVDYDEPAVSVENATVSWNGSDADDTVFLKNIDIKARKGDLVCVTGRVGSGKSGLLKALSGELSILDGSVTVKGSLAYCTQESWLQNMSLRDNILFGQSYDEEWYNRVIKSCELEDDIKHLPKGDQTDVGERGISLSGGQKARVALARAVYARCDVYLFDDVLSAVDEHVSANLVRKIFSCDGLLANRTIILATNNVKVLSHASLIVALSDKQVVASETFKEVVQKRESSMIYRLIQEFGHAADLDREAEHIEERKHQVISREQSSADLYSLGHNAKPVTIQAVNVRLSSDDDEEDEKEAVSLTIFKRYFSAISPFYTWFFVIALCVSVVLTNSINIYLGIMSNKALDSLQSAKWYLVAYMAIVFISAGGILLTQVWNNIVIGLQVSKIMHNQMLWNVMHAPMSFFDDTPLGRLINRFTGDIGTLDTNFPQMLYYTSRSLLNVVMGLVTVVSGSPMVALVIIPLGWVGNQFRKMYVPSSRKISRMASASNSPILSHIEESLKGQAILRAFDRTSQFIETYETRVNYWIELSFMKMNLSQWLGFRIQAMTAVLMLASGLSITLLIARNTLSIGYAAVVLHFASRAGIMVRQTLMFLAQIEVSGVSLERMLEYIDIKQEAAAHIDATEPESSWPQHGQVRFHNLSARYKPDGPDVLKNLSLTINGAEKIGVVGRTGSGKSTLTMAIFRILEAHAGHVDIDGVDTSAIGLYDLRSKLSIIPQDAQIFDGTLRENLDPFNTKTDAELWEVLELCHLKTHFSNLGTGLETILTDGGENLSRGQSQLVCLGRALIHEAKVLVMDEATASVDVETDKIVQETIRKNFSDRTIITIAHRLNTIMDSDRIIVLDAGEIKEFDTPERLLQQKGIFWSLHNTKSEDACL